MINLTKVYHILIPIIVSLLFVFISGVYYYVYHDEFKTKLFLILAGLFILTYWFFAFCYYYIFNNCCKKLFRKKFYHEDFLLDENEYIENESQIYTL